MNNSICTLAVVPVRREPSDVSEMVSQVLFGETAQILDSTEKWLMIRTAHDGYEGWVDRKQMELADDILPQTDIVNRAALVTATAPYPPFLPAGAFIRGEKTPEIASGELLPVEAAAELFIGAPYLWGGRTAMGIDCSGFTQIAYRLAGISIRRDACDQAEQGELVSFIEESKTGDLAFFDNAEGKIIHVGIISADRNSGETWILHASGKVRKDRLDHQGIFHSEKLFYSHNLRMIRRIGSTP